jgi:hypothetical protein
MSILRTGLLVAAVVAVLPADRQQQAHLFDRAANAVHWTATFCDRNGPTCAQAATIWSAFLAKAQFGVQMAYELAQKYSKPDGGYSAPSSSALSPAIDTLRPEDLEPAWRGNGARRGA